MMRSPKLQYLQSHQSFSDRTWHIYFPCLTSHLFFVSQISSNFSSEMSKLRMSCGISLDISSTLMFFPMQVLEPIPNCLHWSGSQQNWSYLHVCTDKMRSESYREEILIKDQSLLFALQPSLRLKHHGIFSKYWSVGMGNPGIYSDDNL